MLLSVYCSFLLVNSILNYSNRSVVLFQFQLFFLFFSNCSHNMSTFPSLCLCVLDSHDVFVSKSLSLLLPVCESVRKKMKKKKEKKKIHLENKIIFINMMIHVIFHNADIWAWTYLGTGLQPYVWKCYDYFLNSLSSG